MRKTLRNVVFSSILAGGLLFSSCGVKDISKEASEAITGEENAYDRALDIAKNPGKYATGSITGNVIEEREKFGIEDYFLKGKEFEGIELAPDFGENVKNPSVLTQKEVGKIRTKPNFEKINKMGVALYLIPSKEESSQLSLIISQFDTKIDGWEFLNRMQGEEDSSVMNLNFIKDDTFCFISLEKPKTLEQEFAFVNCLINYQNRIKWEEIDSKELDYACEKLERLELNNITSFFNALEFQKKYYSMNDKELRKYIINLQEETEKKNPDLLKKIIEKFYLVPYMFPHLEKRIRELSK